MLIGIFIILAFIYWFAEIRTDEKAKRMERINQELTVFQVEAKARANKKKEIEELRHEIEKTKLQIELEQLKMQLPIKVNK